LGEERGNEKEEKTRKLELEEKQVLIFIEVVSSKPLFK
jgi:hypothetical protein